MMRDPSALEDLARKALASGNELEALGEVQPAAARIGSNARLWQWAALLQSSLNRHEEAIVSFDRAARLAPSDPSIAHGRAQIALEAGRPAVDLFEQAWRMNPSSGDVLLGLIAAKFATGEGEAAVDGLAQVVRNSPSWVEGHRTLTQVRTMLWGKDGAARSFAEAIQAAPDQPAVWEAWVATLFAGELYRDGLDVVRRARTRFGGGPWFDLNEAVALSEMGDIAVADPLFAAVVAQGGTPSAAVSLVRHYLRSARLDDALSVIEQVLDPADQPIWPYAAIVWRLAGDPRWAWLEQPGLVSVMDLGDELPPLDRLADVLRGLHRARGEHLDQSVRGGTQTDGPLFSRLEPEIRALRTAVTRAVARHVAQLQPIDPTHPTLAKRRDRDIRFAGSWSVRLRGQGHHANHVHPDGWFSSAFYAALPDDAERGGGEAGWLTLGQPQARLGLDLPPVRTIEPRPGRLVLFPSTMWHGTVPFADGERLTVAFDVAPPR